MRLLSLAALAFLALPAASAGTPLPARDTPLLDPNSGQSANCPATSRYDASRRGKALRSQKLNELPMADAYSAVYRRIGGCEVPIIVRYGIGGR
jgi:hypothetical protein